MSKYTMQLREIYSPTLQFKTPFYTKEDVISWFEDYELTDYLTTDEIAVINARGTWSKHKLATKIVNHYMMREIGLETIGLFREKSKILMSELMEEYLPLIYSASIEYDPLINVDYTETFTRDLTTDTTGSSDTSSTGSSNTSSTGTTTNSNTSSGLDVASDTPQGQISKSAILNGAYASSTSANENTSSDTTNTNTSGTTNTNTSGTSSLENNETVAENYLKRIKGNSGVSATAQKMIALYRDNIRAIDREIINKCNELFMGIY